VPAFATIFRRATKGAWALEGHACCHVVDLTIFVSQIRLNNSFRFGKGSQPRESYFAVYTAIQENGLQTRQQRFYTKGGLRNNVLPLVLEQTKG
jgi:hypothetical protein